MTININIKKMIKMLTLSASTIKRNSIALSLILLLLSSAAQSGQHFPRTTFSRDGTPISFETYGQGEPTLIFVHGWSCDARYWRQQVPYFQKNHTIVLLDLAGHGHSGFNRTNYTMKAFGEDVLAVTNALGSRNVILIGHSMGGAVIAEAARLMPERTVGLIGIDSLENIEYPLTNEELEQMTAPMKTNFREGSSQFVSGMLSPHTDPKLRTWIIDDMSSAPPEVALSAMNEMMSQYISGDAATIFHEIKKPVLTINGDLWPIDYQANRRHMFSFDAAVLRGADHFLMMTRPKEFNQALENSIKKLMTDYQHSALKDKNVHTSQ